MRNPFRRQTETAAPTLRERATALREGLSRRDAAPGERADLYDRLLTAYAEDRAARPISGRDDDKAARAAADLVLNRTWALARDIVSMPPPATLEGLRAAALASAILCEAEHTTEDPTTVAAIGLTRAVLAVTGMPLPPGFCGFGDEPDYKQRDRALFDVLGSLPAWAVAEIEAEDTAPAEPEAAPVTTATASAGVIGFGPDVHIAKLADEFCKSYARNIKADREHMAERMSEAEWLPHYAEAKRLMGELEATEPKTVLGMALKCLGPIGAAGYNAPADPNERQEDAWDRLGTQFADAMLNGTLVPLPVSFSKNSGRDLGKEAFDYAHGLDMSAVPFNCLLRMYDVLHREAEVLSDVEQEVRFYSDPVLRVQNAGGEIIEAESNRLGCLRDACAEEIARRTPETEADRDAILVARVQHEMLCETKIRSKTLLAEIQEAWGGK